MARRRSSADAAGGTGATPPAPLHLRGGLTLVDDPVERVHRYDREMAFGAAYYRTPSTTPPDQVTVEDLAYGVLFAGQPRAQAARSLVEDPLGLTGLPSRPLAKLDDAGVESVIDAIMALVARPGFGCALATKVLHKKRPASVPVLDNQATFSTYLDRSWIPGGSAWPTSAFTVRDRDRIGAAVRAIRRDTRDPDNKAGWRALKRAFPTLTRIELLDKVWWATAHPGGVTDRTHAGAVRRPAPRGGRLLSVVPTAG